MSKWQINLLENNLSLLDALSLRIPAAPRAFLRQLCKKQRITVNSANAVADQCVHTGESITVKESRRLFECLEQSRIQPEQILYEDSHCMVVNKPAGLAIHRAQGHEDNLLHRIQDFLYLRGEKFQVSPVHRLDIGTSGAVLFGKGRTSISQLGKRIMAGQMTKRYLALVNGNISQPGELSSAVPAKGVVKDALTRFRPIITTGGYTLLELELLTGRHHQIRYQLATAGWPIVGDSRYHGKEIDETGRTFLHCHQLSFQSLADEQLVTSNCPLPIELQKQLHSLGFASESMPPEITCHPQGKSR